MKTIIQKIGPLYGEAVNGSVFGQPNGSVAIVPKNQVVFLEENNTYKYIKQATVGGSTGLYLYNAAGTFRGTGYKFRVESQTTPYRVWVEVASDSGFTTKLGSARILQDVPIIEVGQAASGGATIVQGTTYYVRVALVTIAGDIMAYSDIYEVVGI